MKKSIGIIYLLLIFFIPNYLYAQNAATDITHYHLDLKLDFEKQAIEGFAEITFKNINSDTLILMLEDLEVSKVVQKDKTLSFLHQGKHLFITGIGKNENLQTIKIYYSGKPKTDPSGWGGFYFSQGYAFNLGVGFQSKPHNFGRAWFPCNDNFTDKATVSFNINTPDSLKAFCNGKLQSSHHKGNRINWKYKLDQPVPTYLISMAAGPYSLYESKAGIYPVRIAVPENRLDKVKGSFIHLPEALAVFEKSYGNHIWPIIGYVAVPFSGGAMEHPTNIAYPILAINGKTTFETLWAHEFSHHWWGDQVTCRTAWDMWLNEGWASWSELLFLEKVYGPEKYAESLKKEHATVLEKAHLQDSAFLPVTPLPHNYTYGMHAYHKGADVVHNLRTFLGDSLFFPSISQFLQENKYGNITTPLLKESLGEKTGKNLDLFFDYWLYTPGFPHFDLWDMRLENNGQTRIIIRQRKYGSPVFYTGLPLDIRFYSSHKNPKTQTQQVTLSKEYDTFYFKLDFDPSYAIINPEMKITSARIPGKITIGKEIPEEKSLTFMIPEAKIKVEINTFAPGVKTFFAGYNFSNPGIRGEYLKKGYWDITGPPGVDSLEGTMSFYFNNLNDKQYRPGNRVILYSKKGDQGPWTRSRNFSITFLNEDSTTGYVKVNEIFRGKYFLGFETTETPVIKPDYPISPYLAYKYVFLDYSKFPDYERSEILDSEGRVVNNIPEDKGRFNIKALPGGKYFIRVHFRGGHFTNFAFNKVVL